MAFILSSQCLPHAGLSFVKSHHRSRPPQCVVLPSSGHWSSRSPDENAGMLPGGSSQRLASLSPVDSGSERACTPVSTMWDFASKFLPLHLEEFCCPACCLLCVSWEDFMEARGLLLNSGLLKALPSCCSVGCQGRELSSVPPVAAYNFVSMI